MSRKGRAIAPPRFFAGFNPTTYAIKSVGLFLAILGAGSAFADWSAWVSEIRDDVKGGGFTVFYLFLFWEVAWFAFEMVRLKLRYDLAVVRIQNRRRKRR